MTLQPGQMVSHHKLIEKIGEGGMGVVYKALDTKLNRHVAIKFMPAELTADSERRMRFEREAQAAAALSHTNIAVIHEVGDHDGTPFIVMEFLEGQSLREKVEGRTLSTREWIKLALPIAEGLHHAHQRGVVHRDLKPDNVLVTTDGQVKILDFGLAKLLDPDVLPKGADKGIHTKMDTISRELTVAGKVFGTVNYMSPEQARGETVDHRSDLFSFGIMLYQMATGNLPFSGKTEIETLHGIIKEEPPAVASVVDDTPPDVERVVRKALEKEPEHRYQHADEMASDLRTLQRDLDSGRVTTVTTAAAAAGSRAWLPWRWIIIGAVLVIGFLALTLMRRDGGSPGIPAAGAEGRTIGVMGFENLSDPADSENLSRVLMGLVTTDLAETGGLQVASSSKILAAIRQAGGSDGGGFDAALAPGAAEFAGINIMLVGQVNQVGERLTLVAELVDVDTGNTLGSLRQEAASISELFTLAGDIAQEVRSRLGVAEDAVSERIDLARTLTDSPEAYRQYAAGEVALHQRAYPEAIQRFSQAVQHDSTFALAYHRLGMASGWQGESAKATKAKGLALTYADRLPERWQVVLKAEVDYDRGDFDGVYEALNDLVRSVSDIPDAYNRLGEVVSHVSRYWDAKKARKYFEKALEIDPTFKVVFFHLIEDYVAGDDIEAAERLLARTRSENPEDGAVIAAEVTLLAAQGRHGEVVRRVEEEMRRGNTQRYNILARSHQKLGNFERAEAVAEEGITNEAGYRKGFQYASRGVSRIGQGRITEGLADLDKAVAIFEGFGSAAAWAHSIVASFHYERAVVLWAGGDVDGALRAAQDGIDVDRFAGYPHFIRGSILFEAGRTAEGEEVLSNLKTMAEESFSPLADVWVRFLSAEKHLAAGDAARALAEVQAAASGPPEHRERRTESRVLGRVLTARDDRSGAIAAYREFLDPSYLNEEFWGVAGISVLYELAKLEEAEGDLAAAREHYREYLASWGEADTPIVKVPDARKRLEALEAKL